MNRTLVATLAALEAFVAVVIGVGITLVPLTIMWGVQYHLGVDWLIFWRISGDVWLIGHGVNLTIDAPADVASAIGLGAFAPFQLTIAALGFAFLTLLFGFRTGLRAMSTRYPQTAIVCSLAVMLVCGAAIGVAVGGIAPPAHFYVQPSLYQSILLPAFVYAIGLAIGGGLGRVWSDAPHATPIARGIATAVAEIPDAARRVTAAALRAGSAASALVVGVAGVVLALLFATHFGQVVALYENLHTGALGGVLLTLGQLALLPNFVIWVASWLIGPGFSIGTGSSVAPSGTALGPLPSIPAFGAIPHIDGIFAYAGIAVPVLAGLIAALLTRRRDDALGHASSPIELVIAAVGAGVIAGIELGLLAWWSSGSLGPGRLHTTGPDPWLVGAVAAAEVAVAATVGMFAGARRD